VIYSSGLGHIYHFLVERDTCYGPSLIWVGEERFPLFYSKNGKCTTI